MHFREMREFHGLDDEACAIMRYMDDFVTTEPDHIFQRFETLLYMSPRIVNFFKRLTCIFRRSPSPSPSTPPTSLRLELSLRGFKHTFQLLLGALNLVLLLIPVAVLYLADLSRKGYFAVVVVCAAVFVAALTTIEDRTGHQLVGLCAYFAVLVTLLANFQG
ncbi:hypothetical protein F4779DRAFT_621546 [Xylariaceae sp. FL0662B]|nr:hypothetical protein F4779DRAFT_621546 [Xylariaceae sp. FL0662B]